MEGLCKLFQVVLILAGCMAICFGLLSIAMAGLFAQGLVQTNAILPLSSNLILAVGGLIAMLGAKKIEL